MRASAVSAARKSGVDVSRLGEELLRYRVRNNVSLHDIQGDVDVSPSSLSRIERGVGEPDFATLAKIAEFVGQPVDAFLSTNAGKIVHYDDATTADKIAAALWADQKLSPLARRALRDLMAAALENTNL